MSPSEVVLHVVIHGRVQGVGFRYWTESAAGQRGLGGWVRNRRDGTVEAVFAGPPDAVAAMADDCGRGPAGARVDRVETHDGSDYIREVDWSRSRFRVRSTV